MQKSMEKLLNEEIPFQQMPGKINRMSNLVNLWVRFRSIFRFSVNTEFTFDEQLMKKISKRLDFRFLLISFKKLLFPI